MVSVKLLSILIGKVVLLTGGDLLKCDTCI